METTGFEFVVVKEVWRIEGENRRVEAKREREEGKRIVSVKAEREVFLVAEFLF